MSKKYRRIKKTLALTLALVMVLGILPLGIVASAINDVTVVNTGTNEWILDTDSIVVDDEDLSTAPLVELQYGTAVTLTVGGSFTEAGNVSVTSADDVVTVGTGHLLGSGSTVLTIIGAPGSEAVIVVRADGGASNSEKVIRIPIVVTRHFVELDTAALMIAAPGRPWDNTTNLTLETVPLKSASIFALGAINSDDNLGPIEHTISYTSSGATTNFAALSFTLPNASYFRLADGTRAFAGVVPVGAITAIPVTAINNPPPSELIIQARTFGPNNELADRDRVRVTTPSGLAEAGPGLGHGILRWYTNATTDWNASDRLNVSLLTSGEHTLRWRFEPTPGVGVTTFDGVTTVIVHEGVLLPDSLLRIPGMPDNEINVTYTGRTQGTVVPNAPYVSIPNNFDWGAFGFGSRQAALDMAADLAWTVFTVTYAGETLKPEQHAPSTAAPSQAGNYVITIDKTITHKGTDYRIIRTIDLNINPLELEWNTGIIPNKVYDGLVTMELPATLQFNNVVGVDEVYIDGLTVDFASARVGTHPIVNVKHPDPVDPGGEPPVLYNVLTPPNLAGTAEHNYTHPKNTPVFRSGTITPRDVVILPRQNSYKYYDTVDPAIKFDIIMDNGSLIGSPDGRFNSTAFWEQHFWPMTGKPSPDGVKGANDPPSLDTNFDEWITFAKPAVDVGSYAYVLNTDEIGMNFNVSFPPEMTRVFEVRPAEILNFINNTGIANTSNPVVAPTVTAYEAYTTWISSTASPLVPTAQALMDLAVDLGKLPARVNVQTNNNLTPKDR